MYLPARLSGALCSLLFVAACGGGGDGLGGDAGDCSITDRQSTDSDGDRLADCYETTIGTSPDVTDSDGDGLSDFDEVVNKAFDAAINNFQFNPRIADVPDISVTLESIPDISVSYTVKNGASTTTGVSRTNESATSISHSETYEQSVGAEVSSTVGSSGGTSGFDVNSSVTYSESVQETMSWTGTQTSENRRAFTRMSEETSSQEMESTNGDIAALVKVRNRGFQTVTLRNLTVTALEVDPQNPSELQLVKGLSYDTTQGAFPEFDIAPNGVSNALPFVAELSLGKTLDLLRDSRNMIIQPTTWQVVDENGLSFTHNLTDVQARSAQVIVDYGQASGRPVERHYVATVKSAGVNRISVGEALRDVLRLPYTLGAQPDSGMTGLTAVRNVSAVAANRGFWIVLHNFTRDGGITRESDTYDNRFAAYDLDGLSLAKGEVLHLLYVEDQDGDGLGAREEYIHGTSDTVPDSDNDGLSDFEEIKEGWEIPVARGLRRTVYSSPTANDADNDGLVDGAEKLKRSHPDDRDTDDDGVQDFADDAIVEADMREAAYLPLSNGFENDTTVNAGVTVAGSYSFAPDRFGNPGAAVMIDETAEQLEVDNVYAAPQGRGATWVLWFKVDPSLPSPGANESAWKIFELDPAAGPYQWLDVARSGFQVFGDPFARHSIFITQTPLFDEIPVADWHMVAGVSEDTDLDGSLERFTVYYDGELYASRNTDTSDYVVPDAAWVFAGAPSLNDGTGQYLGLIDDLRFFSRALDAEEIRMLFELQD